MRSLIDRCCVLVFVICSTTICHAESSIPKERDKVDLLGFRNGCGNDNPLYQLSTSRRVKVFVKVCASAEAAGFPPERAFSDHLVIPGQPPITLGCTLENDGKVKRGYSIHWEETVGSGHPVDVTDALNDLINYKGSCGAGGCAWTISNRHYFKPIRLTYTYRGQQRADVLKPMSDTLIQGLSADGPAWNKAEFVNPYQPGLCITGADQYPPTQLGR